MVIDDGIGFAIFDGDSEIGTAIVIIFIACDIADHEVNITRTMVEITIGGKIQ